MINLSKIKLKNDQTILVCVAKTNEQLGIIYNNLDNKEKSV